MRLVDLEPHFLRMTQAMETFNVIVGDHETWEERGRPTESKTEMRETHHYVDSFAEADGIMFLCPKCFLENGGSIGTHSCICWFRDRGVPDTASPGPGRWTPNGTSYEDLSFVPGDPPMATSVLLTPPGCGWHGFITGGEVSV